MRRGPVGVNLMLAPFNYPLNEMYAMLIPALLMGNVVVMKLPNIGGLAHVLTAEAFQAALPPGVVNFLTGSGRVTCTPVMKVRQPQRRLLIIGKVKIHEHQLLPYIK